MAKMEVTLIPTGKLAVLGPRPRIVERVTQTQMHLSNPKYPMNPHRRYSRKTGKEWCYAEERESFWHVAEEDLCRINAAHPPEEQDTA